MRIKFSTRLIILLLSTLGFSTFAQCPATCDFDITTDQAGTYTVTDPDTHCVRTTGATTSVTFGGNVKIEKDGGVLMLCPEAGDTVIFEGTFLGSTGPYTIGSAKLINYGDALFTDGTTSMDRTSLYNYGNVWIEDITTDVFSFRDDSEVYNYGTILIDTALNTDGVFQNMASGDSVHVNGKITFSDDALVTNPEGAYIMADLGGSVSGRIDNSGIMEFNDEFLMTSNSILFNYETGVIDVYGDLNVASGSDTTWNEGDFSIHGNADFNGNYWNSGGIFVDSLMTINAGGTVNFTGGYFVVKDLRFNSGTVTADAGDCALFVVLDSSYVVSSGFTPVGVIALIDSSDNSGTGLDWEICGSGDRSDADDSCGLYLKSSQVAQDCFSAALPISLLSFNAHLNNDHVTLNWATSTEINNSHFTIFRSTDGTIWTQLGTVDGAGNSNEVLHYTDFDSNPPKGVIYYRISQTDFDGTVTFSHIAVINNSQLEIIALFPNPNNGSGSFAILSPFTEIMNLEIIDVLGRIVYKDKISILAGNNTIPFNLHSQTKGVYFLRVSSPSSGLSTFKRFEIN